MRKSLLTKMIQTGWGTRAGIGDPAAATAAAATGDNPSNEKLQADNDVPPSRAPYQPTPVYSRQQEMPGVGFAQ